MRIPRHILSKDCVQFYCQLCPTGPMSAYRDYVDHMIDSHLRVQLLRGLDMTKKNPACPFPSCHGTLYVFTISLYFRNGNELCNNSNNFRSSAKFLNSLYASSELHDML